MDRKEFLSAIGLTAASFTIVNCLGCSKGSDGASPSTSGPTGVDFTLDLTANAYSALNTNGGYVAYKSVIVARTLNGDYIAVQQTCTHENYPLAYQASNHRFYCNNHGATFSEAGAVENGPANRSLITYKTSVSGTSLRVYS